MQKFLKAAFALLLVLGMTALPSLSLTAYAYDDPPEPLTGRLLLTNRESGNNAPIAGAVFELRRALDGAFVGQLVTDSFGEAAFDTFPGEYHLRKITPAPGFTLNTDRVSVVITGGRLTEINITSTRTDSPGGGNYTGQSGRLLVTVRDADGEYIRNVRLELHSAADDYIYEQLVTDQFGEATLSLPAGDFFLRQVSVPQGFILNRSRVNLRIAYGRLNEVSILLERADRDGSDDDSEEDEQGRLLATIISGSTGERLAGAMLSVHHAMTDEFAGSVTSDQFGEVSIFLAPGGYFLRQVSMGAGYTADLARFSFTITPGQMSSLTIVATALPEPEVTGPAPGGGYTPGPDIPTVAPGEEVEGLTAYGRLEIITRAETSGSPLPGGVFAVYDALTGRRIARLTTGGDGMAYIEVSPGDYFVRELRPTFGFLLEDTRILASVAEGRATQVTMTKERDESIPYADVYITLPQMGVGMGDNSPEGGSARTFMLFVMINMGLTMTAIYMHRRGYDYE